jgi:hypothetical protein
VTSSQDYSQAKFDGAGELGGPTKAAVEPHQLTAFSAFEPGLEWFIKALPASPHSKSPGSPLKRKWWEGRLTNPRSWPM